MKLYLLAEKYSERLKYITDFIFNDIIGVEVIIETDVSMIPENQVIIEYTSDIPKTANAIYSDGLLYKTGIEDIVLNVKDDEVFIKTFFNTEDNKYLLSFDILSASFYLITRYEEYLPFMPDRYGRFQVSDSFAYKNSFLDVPLVDIWAYKLKEILKEKFSSFVCTDREFKYIPTFDVDNSFAFRHKGFFRTIGGTIRSLFMLQPVEVFMRYLACFRIIKDPFFNFIYLKQLVNSNNLSAHFFFLLSDTGKINRNYKAQFPPQKKILKKLKKDKTITIGVHPSTFAATDEMIFAQEVHDLYSVLKHKVTHSRQHYIKISFPDYYETLVKMNIEEDYSMGYPELPGFRASTCSPFNFFNIKKNKKERVRIFSFPIMDSTYQYSLNKSPQDFISDYKKYFIRSKEVNGYFIPLLHNESFSGIGKKMKTWKEPLENLLCEKLD